MVDRHDEHDGNCTPENCRLTFVQRELFVLTETIRGCLATLDGMYAVVQALHEFRRGIESDTSLEIERQTYRAICAAMNELCDAGKSFSDAIKKRVGGKNPEGKGNDDQSFKFN